MKLKLLLIALFVFVTGFAQNATLKGMLTDKDMNGEALPFASVSIKGTSIGTNTDETGNYTLSVPAGEQTVVFAFMGYETKEVTLTFTAGETQTLNQEMGSTSVQLSDVVIETVVNREKESALLLEQKKAVEMKQVIGSQELSRKGVGDAAGAVAKTTGVAKAEGVNNVFVRGLGDRYNSTTLNGLPLPSEDPEYKNISLEFFGSNIIKNVGINKTFSSNLYSDVGGANIDITSKDADKKSILSASAGIGINTNAMNNTVLVADGAYNYFGFLKNGTGIPMHDLNTYGFKTSLKPTEQSTPVNTSFNIVAGKKYELPNNQSLSVLGVVLSESGYQYKEGNSKAINAIGLNYQDLKYSKSEYKATQALLGSAKYRFDKGSLAYNTLFLHDNNQSVADYHGFARNVNDNDFATNSFIRRQQLNNNNLFVNQLLGEYKLNEKINLNAAVAYNMIRASEPDRRTNSFDYDYVGDNGGGYTVSANSAGSNNRYFATLKENDIAGKAEAAYTFNPESNLQKVLTVGVNVRHTTRDFSNTQFNFDFNSPVAVDVNNPDALFNQHYLDLGKLNGGYNLVTGRGVAGNPRAFDPFYYNGDRNVYAGFAQIEYPFSERLIGQLGVRFETFKQTVDWDTNLSSSVTNPAIDPSNIQKSYVLPSMNLKYNTTENSALRVALSQTYTMPQFKETAPFLYSDITFSSFGNPDLVPSTNYNADIKYDWYLSRKEIISVGGIYKYIQDPISRVRALSAANDLTYVNTEKAFVTGIEIEVKKNIFSLEAEDDIKKNDLSFGLNGSYLYTEQTQNDDSRDRINVQFTHDKGKMQGAAPILLNTDLSWYKANEDRAFTSTVVFAYFYNRVYSIGTAGNENLVEKTVPSLDFINKLELLKSKLSISMNFKNILNPKYRITQEATNNGTTRDYEINTYRKGMFVSLGLNWTL